MKLFLVRGLKSRAAQSAIALLAIVFAALLVSEQPAPVRVGPRPDGSFLLNSGWLLRPAGEQIGVDTLPMRGVLSHDGRFLLVLNGGYKPPTISVIDVAAKKEIKRVLVRDKVRWDAPSTPGAGDAWYGLAFAPSGTRVYAGGGSQARVYEFEFTPETGDLKPGRDMIAVSDLANKGLSFIGDVAVSPDGHLLYAADVHLDSIAVFNLQSAMLIERWKTGKRPYRILVHPSGRSLLVSGWGDAALYRHDALSGEILAKFRTGPHPTDLLWLAKPAPTDEGESSKYPARLFVAAANTNAVLVYGVAADGDLQQIEDISVALTPEQPLGMTPSAVAMNKDATRLYITCSDGNAVAAVDITSARSRVLGFIPTGWYPTGVVTLPDGRLAILNGKGLGSHANPNGPNPTKRPEPSHQGTAAVEYVGRIQTGTVGLLDSPEEGTLASFTRTVRENSPYRDDLQRERVEGPQADIFTKAEGHRSPIEHVIYIVKENRTYDQVLGDIGKGNSDPSLVLFGEKITPNLHQLARDFILYDNFYENSDVSADGHNWANAAIAPDYTVKMWPNSYAGRRKTYDYEGGEPADTPPAGYIWNNAMAAGVTVRNYGDWVVNVPLKNVKDNRQVASLNDPSLKPVTDMSYRTFDLEYPDVERAKEFLREWSEFAARGEAPQLSLVRLGNDHTSGTAPGKLTPLALNADNDQAVGMLVEAISHSKFWPTTAIFIIEDDAQNGPDHVDSHRAPAFVISPYTRRGIVDSTMYNQAGLLHTIEALLGIHPMTQFDASGTVMFGSFLTHPDSRPWSHLAPQTSLTERNPANGPGSEQSARLDFSDADRADDDTLNDILWRAIRGGNPPAPVTSVFGR